MLVGAKPYLLTSIEAQHDRWNSFSKVFICHAVAKYADTIATPDYMTGLYATTRMIQRRLGQFETYECWIENYHPHLLAGLTFNEMNARYQEGRHAWLDSLIKEFSV